MTSEAHPFLFICNVWTGRQTDAFKVRGGTDFKWRRDLRGDLLCMLFNIHHTVLLPANKFAKQLESKNANQNTTPASRPYGTHSSSFHSVKCSHRGGALYCHCKHSIVQEVFPLFSSGPWLSAAHSHTDTCNSIPDPHYATKTQAIQDTCSSLVTAAASKFQISAAPLKYLIPLQNMSHSRIPHHPQLHAKQQQSPTICRSFPLAEKKPKQPTIAAKHPQALFPAISLQRRHFNDHSSIYNRAWKCIWYLRNLHGPQWDFMQIHVIAWP